MFVTSKVSFIRRDGLRLLEIDVKVELRKRAERLAPKYRMPVDELYARALKALEEMDD